MTQHFCLFCFDTPLCFALSRISPFFVPTIFHDTTRAKAYSEPSQASKMELLTKIAHSLQLHLRCLTEL